MVEGEGQTTATIGFREALDNHRNHNVRGWLVCR